MAERQDIDALLIGALYGELDGDERARLDAHLASHPQDRSALDGLRSTRELLKEANLPRAFAVEEPSPAITAMLLQEAARRAPTPASKGGVLAFLAGLLKPFAASPALSAAAALVLVGGAAGLLYSQGKFKASEPRVQGSAEVSKAENTAMGPLGSGSAAGSAAASAPTTPNVDGMDDYRVRLADEEAARNNAQRQLNEQELRKNAEVTGTGDALNRDGKEVAATRGLAQGAGSGSNFTFQPAPAATATAKLDADKGGHPGYITIEKKDEPSVLAPDGRRFERGAAPADTTIAGDVDNDEAQNPFADTAGAKKKAPARESVAAEGRAAGGGGGAATTSSAMPPATDMPAPAPVSPPPPPAIATQKPATGSTSRTAPQKPVAGKSSGSGTQQVARDQGKAGTKAYDPTKAAALDAWARTQHARMVKLVNAGKCTEAGQVGAEIARKAPDYYQNVVFNDRAVRACRGYVDRARRAKSEDAKTKAAAPKANAPDAYDADVEAAH